MANDYFSFKQFTIKQDRCAMKVGTDGVLLGAWVSARGCRRILDVGTGTGLIALMLAQRSEASLDAIDIDKGACLQAGENISSSPFSGRVRVFNTPFEEFVFYSEERYDLIVSNPPYFNASLRNPDDKRAAARHVSSFSYTDIILGGKKLLSPGGRLAFILPSDQEKELMEIVAHYNIYVLRKTRVYPTAASRPKRIMVELSFEKGGEPVQDDLVIEMEQHVYSEGFAALVKDFYLDKA